MSNRIEIQDLRLDEVDLSHDSFLQSVSVGSLCLINGGYNSSIAAMAARMTWLYKQQAATSSYLGRTLGGFYSKG